MRFGFLLRHVGEPGGIGVYTRSLLKALLRIDPDDRYYLYYRSSSDLGRYAHHPHVVERALPARSRLVWDQWTAPRRAFRDGIDLLVNLKLSVPLFSRVPSAFTFYGPERFLFPSAYPLLDRLQGRLLTPLYLRRADSVLVLTEDTRRHVVERRGGRAERTVVLPAAADPRFRPLPAAQTRPLREKYGLPERFLLFVGGLHPIKNIGRAFAALRLLVDRYGKDTPPLVVAGFERWKVQRELALVDRLALRDFVRFAGYVPDADLPALYAAATLLLFPSLYEGFGIPILEAMASGCPVVTSGVGGGAEVAGGAALLVDPGSPEDIAAKVGAALELAELRQEMSARGLARAVDFAWERSAEALLRVLQRSVAARG